MNDKEKAKQKTQILKELRTLHEDSVTETQSLLKHQRAIRKQLKAAFKDGPKTIPEIAKLIDFPKSEILWHVVAMKKYDLIMEVGRDGEYYKYSLPAKEKKS